MQVDNPKVNLQRDSEIQGIEERFLLNQVNFSLILGRITNCMCSIEVYEAFRDIEKKHSNLKYKNFWKWLQDKSLLRLIVIDSYGIWKETRVKNTSANGVKVMLENILNRQQCNELLEHSKLVERSDALGTIVKPFKGHRDKRFAHLDLDNTKVEGVECNFKDLLVPLSDLLNSLKYILNYLLNPEYIIDNKWNVFSLKGEQSSQSRLCTISCGYNQIIRDCNSIMENMTGIEESKVPPL